MSKTRDNPFESPQAEGGIGPKPLREPSWRAIWIGLVISSAALPASMFAVSFVVDYFTGEQAVSGPTSVLATVVLTTYATAFTVSTPVVVVLRRLRRLTPLAVIAVGALFATVLASVAIFFIVLEREPRGLSLEHGFWGMMYVLILLSPAFVFAAWLHWHRRPISTCEP